MEKLFGYLMRSLKLLKRRKILRRMVAILECIVVVATTWSLVLPAITLSGQAAAQQDGIVLEGSMDPDYAAAAPEGVDDPVREESVDPVPGGTEDSAAGEADASMSGETGDPVSGEAGNSASAEGGEDASATLIGSTGLPAQHVQSMAFDQNTGELFWAQYYSRFSSHGLYLVDPATAETQFLGRINGDGCQLACFFMVDTSHHDGVQILPENSIVLYPNPAKEIVNVEYTMYKHMDIETVEVIDVYGKVVRTAVETNNHLPLQTAQINVSNLSDGLYFVRVTTSTGQITKPFIKQ